MADDTGQDGDNSLIVIGDEIQPTPHLVALALRKHLDSVKMILIGPNLAGNPMAMANKATGKFFEPIVQGYLLSGAAARGDFESISPEELLQRFDQRLDSVNKFPSVPDYLWELVDFKTFFKLYYLTSPKIKSTSIAFLQQTV